MRHLSLLLLPACAAPPAGTCASSAGTLRCAHQTLQLDVGGRSRTVHWSEPPGEPPEGGWRAAWLFQGSLVPAELFWQTTTPSALGAVHQVELTEALLDAGFVVVTPAALGHGLGCWDTNVPPWSTNWEDGADAALIDALFAEQEAGTFGPVDPEGLVAGGISSGGYLTSRLASTFPDRFAATLIASASWRTCVGPVCEVPDTLEATHPPTRFQHGQLDPVVPIATLWPYVDRLEQAGVPVDVDVAPLGVHAWPADTAPAAVAWFDRWTR